MQDRSAGLPDQLPCPSQCDQCGWISLVRIKGTSKRIRQPRSLTTEQFRLLVSQLREPFGTTPLVCICFDLRISECLALRWSDVDWLNRLLRVERGIVEQNVDDVKTDESRKSLAIADELLERLKVRNQTTEFSGQGDWIFASPLKIGRLPYSYTGFWRELDRAAKECGIGHIGTHTFRHTYRMWIDSVGTPIGVQQKLMRHSDIRTTMNIYGDAMSEDKRVCIGVSAKVCVFVAFLSRQPLCGTAPPHALQVRRVRLSPYNAR